MHFLWTTLWWVWVHTWLGWKRDWRRLIIVLISSNWSGLRCACVRNCVVHESRRCCGLSCWKPWKLENKTASLREIDARIENTCDFNWLDMWGPIGSKADGMQTPEQIIEHQKGQGQVVVQWCQVNSLWDSAGNGKVPVTDSSPPFWVTVIWLNGEFFLHLLTRGFSILKNPPTSKILQQLSSTYLCACNRLVLAIIWTNLYQATHLFSLVGE